MDLFQSETVRLMTSAIAPVTLISGVGLLLLSMTNRYNHVINRIRSLAHEEPIVADQIRRLYRRACHLRFAIILNVTSIFFVALTMLFIFVSMILGFHARWVSESCFMLSLICLVTSMAMFIEDFAVSLTALQQEVQHSLGSEIL